MQTDDATGRYLQGGVGERNDFITSSGALQKDTLQSKYWSIVSQFVTFQKHMKKMAS